LRFKGNGGGGNAAGHGPWQRMTGHNDTGSLPLIGAAPVRQRLRVVAG